ncbi:MAG: hypothetical protein J5633_10100 [Oscillospiraceae bacterium]|nr:hypothetical protein [Oscillospiraceae bacterium]
MKDRDLEHPVITNLLATGEPDGGRRREVLCPACGDPCCTFYANRFGSVFACENCVSVEDAEYLMEE